MRGESLTCPNDAGRRDARSIGRDILPTAAHILNTGGRRTTTASVRAAITSSMTRTARFPMQLTYREYTSTNKPKRVAFGRAAADANERETLENL